MDGLSRAAGGGVTIELGGKTFMLGPLAARDLGTIENEILRKRDSALDLALEKIKENSLPKEVQETLIDRALRLDSRSKNYVSPEELHAFLDGREGVAFCFWIMIRKENQNAKLQDVQEAIDDATDEEMSKFIKARDMASGFDELGNVTGPAQDRARRQKDSTGKKRSGKSRKRTT